MSGIAGRSPFPSRNRRRSAVTHQHSSADDSGGSVQQNNSTSGSFTSPFILHSSVLSQPRVSPRDSYISPTSAVGGHRRPRRFFDSDHDARIRRSSGPSRHSKDDGGVLGSLGRSTNHNGESKNEKFLEEATNNLSADCYGVVDGMDLNQLRSLAQNTLLSSTGAASPDMAVFFASILYSKTNSLEDAFFYAQALVANGEARRAVQTLDRAGLLLGPSPCSLEQRLESTLLAAQALASRGEWQEALRFLEDGSTLSADITSRSAAQALTDDDDAGWQTFADAVKLPHGSTTVHPVSRLCLIRGKCYDEMSHPPRATLYWKRALTIDPKCVQALDALIQRNLITSQNTYELISSLEIDPDMDWLKCMYLARIHMAPQGRSVESEQNHDLPINATPFANGDLSSIQLATPSMHMATDHGQIFEDQVKNQTTDKTTDANDRVQSTVNTAFEKLWTRYGLDNSPEALAIAATRAYRLYDFQTAFGYCQELASLDPLCRAASFVHVATLLALGHKRLLFALAHEWTEASPDASRSWFAVGCYYYSCGRYHVAQQHFCRATRLDPLCAEAWIAFGCAFAACDESDQALASFRAAQRLAPAEHTPMLYMGMEYVRTNHLVLAQHSLMAALNSSADDPLCLHELGVAAYRKKEFVFAVDWFIKAVRRLVHIAAMANDESPCASDSVIESIEEVQDRFWEPVIFDLGHCFRKIRNFAHAVICYEKCLVLSPGNATVLSALGFTRHIMGEIDPAIEFYHQALSRVPDDPFCCEMLNRALQEAISVKLDLNEPVAGPQPMSPQPGSAVSARTSRGADQHRNGYGSRSAQRRLDRSLAMDTSDIDISMG